MVGPIELKFIPSILNSSIPEFAIVPESRQGVIFVQSLFKRFPSHGEIGLDSGTFFAFDRKLNTLEVVQIAGVPGN